MARRLPKISESDKINSVGSLASEMETAPALLITGAVIPMRQVKGGATDDWRQHQRALLPPVPIRAGSNNGLMGHPKRSDWTPNRVGTR